MPYKKLRVFNLVVFSLRKILKCSASIWYFHLPNARSFYQTVKWHADDADGLPPLIFAAFRFP